MDKVSSRFRPGARIVAWLAAGLFAGCAAVAPTPPLDAQTRLRWLDRLTWGASERSAHALEAQGLAAWLQDQLHPRPAVLPAAAQAQIDALTISRVPVEQSALALDEQRRAIDAQPDEAQKTAARQAWLQSLTRLSREAQQRFVLRALYSPNQLQEQMVWFWMNHFNVNARKAAVRGLVGDYEETAIRPYALGRFRDLLGATARHPAMLVYLDNARNAGNRLNENYARELMELHTLGADGGYTQADVQELARVLTGVGVTLRPADAAPPNLRPARQADYVRAGLFEFNPARHDYGPKTLLGRPIERHGLAELDEALDRLAQAPATARFVARKLAVFFVADQPPPALVDRMAARFRSSDGDIAAVLGEMVRSSEFAASLGSKFRDPVHYAIAGARLADDGRAIADPLPLVGWIARMGQPLYGHETPDGYPLTQDAWASAGQMNTRFDIARAMGDVAALADSPIVRAIEPTLGAPTRQALAQARTPAEWNTLLLASPEFMKR